MVKYSCIQDDPNDPTIPFGGGEPNHNIDDDPCFVDANDPNFDESIFTIPFPEGYLIDDQVTGRKYTVGEE